MLDDQQRQQLDELKSQLKPARKRRRRHRARELTAAELDLSPARRKRLEAQGTAGHRGAVYPPGMVLSVSLDGCGHRARVEALTSGLVPRRAKCPVCHLWRHTIPGTARKPLRAATRTVVAERVETRDGRDYLVKVLETPRRARF